MEIGCNYSCGQGYVWANKNAIVVAVNGILCTNLLQKWYSYFLFI